MLFLLQRILFKPLTASSSRVIPPYRLEIDSRTRCRYQKPKDAQIPYIKRHSTVGLLYSRVPKLQVLHSCIWNSRIQRGYCIKQSQEIKWTQNSSLKVFLAFKYIKNNIVYDYSPFPQYFHICLFKRSYMWPPFQKVISLFPFTVQRPANCSLHSPPRCLFSFTQTLHCSNKTAPRSH